LLWALNERIFSDLLAYIDRILRGEGRPICLAQQIRIGSELLGLVLPCGRTTASRDAPPSCLITESLYCAISQGGVADVKEAHRQIAVGGDPRAGNRMRVIGSLFEPGEKYHSRVARSFEPVHRKSQDHVYSRLHRHVETGELEGFGMICLGQQDGRPLIARLTLCRGSPK
jgi:hypothetical protein